MSFFKAIKIKAPGYAENVVFRSHLLNQEQKAKVSSVLKAAIRQSPFAKYTNLPISKISSIPF